MVRATTLKKALNTNNGRMNKKKGWGKGYF